MRGRQIFAGCLCLSVFLLSFFCRGVSAADVPTRTYDLVVVGAGTSGVAAAVQAARDGLSVALVEASDFVGGQMTGAAVSTMDDVGRTRTGLYLEFIDRVRAHYRAYGVATNICLWGGDTIAVEPAVAQRILKEMLARAGNVDLFPETVVVAARKQGNWLTALEAERGGENPGRMRLAASVFVDATEHGDLLPLAGARYRVGNSVSPKVDMAANVQDITYVAVVKRYPGGLPEVLKLPGPPPEYEKYVARFRSIVTADGDTWPGRYPFDIPSHNAYRALPDIDNDHAIVGDDASTWRFITKTGINWANDYPGRPGDHPGLSVRYIEDPEFRKQTEREAMHKTLCFLWYMQSELGMTDWSIDDGQGYGGWFSNDWQTADDPLLPPAFAAVLRHFPPFPYVREGRRVVGVRTVAEHDIARDAARGRAYRNEPSSLALGEYPVDVHGSHLDRYMEHDLGETHDSFPKTWVGSQGVFPVPFEVFVPEEVDGLLATEKNLSVSRMVNGAIRLHPIAMHTGQAVGAIASEAVRRGVAVRDVEVLAVQRRLMDAGCYLALDRYVDVEPGDVYWAPVQWASLYEGLGGISRTRFGVNLPIRVHELERVFGRALPGVAFGFAEYADGDYLTKGDFLDALRAAMGTQLLRIADSRDLEYSLKRGDALSAVLELLSLR